jgi:hypothetical protein
MLAAPPDRIKGWKVRDVLTHIDSKDSKIRLKTSFVVIVSAAKLQRCSLGRIILKIFTESSIHVLRRSAEC